MTIQETYITKTELFTTEELIRGIKNKSEPALSFLYNSYSAPLFGIIGKIIADRYIAEDILQHVFIKAWLNIDKYNKEKGNFYTWLINISRNEALDHLRSRRHKQGLLRVPIEQADFNAIDNSYRKIDNLDFPKLLFQLGAEHKEIIDLSFFQGYTHQEIAKMLHLPLGTVKTKIRIAYKIMREYLCADIIE